MRKGSLGVGVGTLSWTGVNHAAMSRFIFPSGKTDLYASDNVAAP